MEKHIPDTVYLMPACYFSAGAGAKKVRALV